MSDYDLVVVRDSRTDLEYTTRRWIAESDSNLSILDRPSPIDVNGLPAVTSPSDAPETPAPAGDTTAPKATTKAKKEAN